MVEWWKFHVSDSVQTSKLEDSANTCQYPKHPDIQKFLVRATRNLEEQFEWFAKHNWDTFQRLIALAEGFDWKPVSSSRDIF
jgi:hypothetical protein